MRVPEYGNQKVGLSTPEVSEPKVPIAPDSAFGTNVYEANARVGEAGVRLGEVLVKHIQERNDWKAKEQATEIFNKYANAGLDQFFNTGMKDVTNEDGSTSQIPIGILNRKGHTANGSVLEFRQQRQAMRESYSSQLKNPLAVQYFNELAGKADESDYKKVIEHESKEWQSAAKDSVYQFSDTQLKRYSLADETEKKNIILSVNNRYEEAVGQGLMTNEEADKERVNFDKQIFYSNVNLNPQGTINELSKEKEGLYKNLEPEDRSKLISQAEEVIKQQKAQNEQLQQMALDKNETAMIDAKIQGQLNPLQVLQARESGQISARFADTMINALHSSKAIGANTNSDTFNKIAEDILNPIKKEDEIRNELLNKNAVGELSNDDFKTLNTFFQSINKEAVDKAMPKKTWLERLFNNGKDAGIRQEIITDMYKQYMNKVSTGEDPGKAVSEIISMHLNQHLTEQAKTPNRQYANNPQTKQRAYSDDGGVTWHDEKTGNLIK